MAKHRSPAYPAIDLQEAVSLIEKLYPVAMKHPVGADVVAEAWGYKALASASPYVAAAKHYGLLEEKRVGNDRMLQMSSLARDIAVDKEGESPERMSAIKQAAVMPSIFAEMWEKWGGDLPPDGEIRRYLERERDFNPKYVARVASNYRASLDFAKATGGDGGPIKKDTHSRIGDLPGARKNEEGSEAGRKNLQVGSYVQRTSEEGPFEHPRRIMGFSEDAAWAYVEGVPTGTAVSELTATDAPANDTASRSSRDPNPPANPFFHEGREREFSRHRSPGQGASSGSGSGMSRPAILAEEGPYINYPLSHGNGFELRLKARMSAEDFDRFKKLIELSEASLVREDAQDQTKAAGFRQDDRKDQAAEFGDTEVDEADEFARRPR